jgi:protein SCO1
MRHAEIRRPGRKTFFAAAALALAWAAAPPPVLAHAPADPRDEILKEIGVDERLGALVPADAVFRDQDGRSVRIGDFFGSGPLIVTLNYFTCPMLCPLTLQNLLGTAGAMRGISLERDFRIVTVSIDPEDGAETAAARAAEVHAMMGGMPDPAARWAFLAGDPGSIEAVTGAVGFRYRKVGNEFAHPDAGVVLTPEGRISRYLYGVEQHPSDLKLALIEAAGGRIGESRILNRVLLYCFQYDPVGRKYALYARNIMKAGGVLTLALLGALYLALWKSRGPRPNPRDGGIG